MLTGRPPTQGYSEILYILANKLPGWSLSTRNKKTSHTVVSATTASASDALAVGGSRREKKQASDRRAEEEKVEAAAATAAATHLQLPSLEAQVGNGQKWFIGLGHDHSLLLLPHTTPYTTQHTSYYQSTHIQPTNAH